MSRTFSRVVATVAALLVGSAGLAGCGGGSPAGSPEPIGLMKSGKELLLFIGSQCQDAEYPSRVRVVNYDLGTKQETQPVLWEVATTTPNLTPSVSIGKVPYQFTELTNHIPDERISSTIRVQVDMGKPVTATFDTTHLVPGQVLTSTNEFVTLDTFRANWSCP